MNLSVVIPVYNEADVITATLEGVEKALRMPHEVLVVYDFDDESTVPIVRQLMTTNQCLRLVKNNRGPGVANALRAGFDAAGGEAVVVMMGDSCDDCKSLNPMYAQLQGGADLVCASRYIRGGNQFGGPLVKSFLSGMAGRSLHLFTGIHTSDVTNSFKMYRKTLLRAITTVSEGFEISMEITVKAFLRGYRISEIPTTWRDRKEGNSKFRLWISLPKYLYWYWFTLWATLVGETNRRSPA